MTTRCPDCGRENLTPPAGHVAPCGRRVGYGDAPGVIYPHDSQWRERMLAVNTCRDVCQSAMTEDQKDAIYGAYLGICVLHTMCRKAGLGLAAAKSQQVLADLGTAFPFIPEWVALSALRQGKPEPAPPKQEG